MAKGSRDLGTAHGGARHVPTAARNSRRSRKKWREGAFFLRHSTANAGFAHGMSEMCHKAQSVVEHSKSLTSCEPQIIRVGGQGAVSHATRCRKEVAGHGVESVKSSLSEFLQHISRSKRTKPDA